VVLVNFKTEVSD